MNKAQVLDYGLQTFSTDYFTNEKLRNVFCSEKAEHRRFPARALDLLTQLLMNSKISLLDNDVLGFIDDLLKVINPNKEKPNFKLCSIIARKLGFNVSSKETKFIIFSILYLYENNVDECNLDKIFEILSQKYNIEEKNIKWSIENSLKAMKRYTNQDLLRIVFSKYDGRLVSARYIIILAVFELRKKFTPQDYTEERVEKILYSI